MNFDKSIARLRLFEQRIERPGEFRSVERLNRQLSTVDQKGRRAANPQPIGFRNIGLNHRRGLFIVDALVKRRHVQPKIGGVLFQIRFGERAGKFADPHGEQAVMVFPELALPIGALGGIRRPMRFIGTALGSEIDDGIVLVRELDFVGLKIGLIELALRAKREFSTVWSLKVRILDQFDLGS
jgi:hypothetical protein